MTSRDGMRLSLMGIATTVWLVGAPACSNQTIQDEPPEVPPASTLVMDFADFEDVDGAGLSARGALHDGDHTHAHFGFAYTNVVVWNTIVSVGMAIPVAAFVESFNHEPTQQADGTWVWAYEFDVGLARHSAELHTVAVGGDIEWNMYISREGQYSDVNWFTGSSNLPATAGTWTLYRDPDDPAPFIGIEWSRDPIAETATVKYTNIVPDGPENGGYISYGTTTDETYDAFYDLYNKGADNHTDIEWNRDTKAGRVRDEAHFEDGSWHCWNAAFEDADC